MAELEAEGAWSCRLRSPPRPDPDPLFFSSPPPLLVAPSVIAARRTEAICSTEACRHGDAGELYGFAVV